jgi:serine/threonine-protein kinase
MGAVWRAHHVGLNMPCALKFILDEAADSLEARARFEQEAQAVARLRCPNVVQLLDHGVWEDTPYIAMELLEGEDLAKRLTRRGRLKPQEVSAIITQVARALGKAHAVGLVHRDLKPANIFLVKDDDGEVVKVLDFGIAKYTQEPLADLITKTGLLLGTPPYVSPEQARGTKTVDYRSDLWSLGVIAYQCITGRLPFEGDTLVDLLFQIVVSPLPVPSLVASVPDGFDAWWARAVARDPAERFQSAREMAESLVVVAGLPAGTAPPPPGTGPPQELGPTCEAPSPSLSTPTLLSSAVASLPSAIASPPSAIASSSPPSTGHAFSSSAHRALGDATTVQSPSRRRVVVGAAALFGLAAGLTFVLLHGLSSTAPALAPVAPVIAGAQPQATPLPAPLTDAAPDAQAAPPAAPVPSTTVRAPVRPSAARPPRPGPSAASPKPTPIEAAASPPAPAPTSTQKKHEGVF